MPDLSDVDYERLAERVADRVWNYSVTTTISNGSAPANDSVTLSPETFTDHSILGARNTPMWQDSITATFVDPLVAQRIHDLEEKVRTLEETLKMVGQLLDEHLKRSNPPADRMAKRSIIIEREEEGADPTAKK